ncbi:MAG TPA: peptidoglycan recognition protein, partial [Kineosporiaceae bacterium]|nr:peptidoglycan recognition protein [Kineosporiaceae bacterium]
MRLPLPPAATLALAVAVTPALVVLPTVTRPSAAPHPVGPRVVAVPLHGVDRAALRELRADSHGVAPSLRPPAGLLPGVRRALAGDLAVNPVPAPAPQPAVLTGELTPAATGTGHVDLVAVSWDRGTAPGSEPAVQVRVREESGWTGWQLLDADGDGPDGAGAEGRKDQARGPRTTAPLLTDGADAVQVRVDTPDGTVPVGLKVDLVDGGSSGADAPPAPPATAAADTGRPVIVTRRQWGADERLVTGTTAYDPAVKALFIHHTDTTNDYSPAQAYAQVRAIYAFHTKVRGWNDIGYNLLVDRFGQVYEGRRGSITRAVTGAHTGGFNSQSLGIAVLGTFSTQAPPPAALRSLSAVVGWKAAQYELDPRAAVRLVSAGGPYTAHQAGEKVRVTALSSHRDVGLTECPGDRLWDQLPSLRQQAAGLLRPGLVAPAVSAPSAVPGADGVTVTGGVPTVQRWTLTATSQCGTTAVRTLTGRADTRISARWDLKDDAGVPVPPGIYHLTLTTRSPVGAAPAWGTDVEVLPVDGGPAGTCPVRRVVAAEGADAVTRAVAVGRTTAPDAATVVLTGLGAAAVDGVVAAPLAKTL